TPASGRVRAPEGRSDRLAGPPRGGPQAAFLLPWLSIWIGTLRGAWPAGSGRGDLEHAVFVARGDLLGIDPVGDGQAPRSGPRRSGGPPLLLPLRPALAGDGEGRALQGDLGHAPARGVRTALQNAASVAGLLLTTEAMVAEKP